MQSFLTPEAVCELDAIPYFIYPGNDRYLLSKCGKVYDSLTDRPLKSSQTTSSYDNTRSYYSVHLNVEPGVYKREKVHRMLALTFLANPDSKDYVDHIDHDRTNNKLTNLRWVTNKENQRNRKPKAGTGYLGVCAARQKFRAYIRIDYKHEHLGMFDTAREAALAYNKRAEEVGYLTRNIIHD